MDHPSISLSSFVKPAARLAGLTRRHMLVALRYSSGMTGCLMATCSWRWHQIGLACGGRADRLDDPVREQDVFRRPGKFGWRTGMREASRWWSSTCCRTGATWSG